MLAFAVVVWRRGRQASPIIIYSLLDLRISEKEFIPSRPLLILQSKVAYRYKGQIKEEKIHFYFAFCFVVGVLHLLRRNRGHKIESALISLRLKKEKE